MLLRGTGHSGLEAESRGQRLHVDPWWVGAAFDGRWQALPAHRPGPAGPRPGDAIVVTSLYDDRLHARTLAALPAEVPLLVPGFVGLPPPALLATRFGRPVRVLSHGVPYEFGRRFFITAWIHGDEAALLLDDDHELVVHAGTTFADAPPALADLFARFCRLVRGRVDFLLAGASPLPVGPVLAHLPGHDPCRAARARATAAHDSLRHLVSLVRPARACVLPVHPAVVDERLLWLDRALAGLPLADEAAPATSFFLPGDRLENGRLHRGAAVRPDAALRERVVRRTLDLSPRTEPLSDAHLRELGLTLAARARALRATLPVDREIALEIRLREHPATALHIEASRARANAGLGPPRTAGPRLELTARTLEALLHSVDGAALVGRAQGALAFLDHAGQRPQLAELLAALGPEPARRRLPERVLAAWRQALPLAVTAARLAGFRRRPAALPSAPRPDLPTRRAA
jgi:hypothetical protein